MASEIERTSSAEPEITVRHDAPLTVTVDGRPVVASPAGDLAQGRRVVGASRGSVPAVERIRVDPAPLATAVTFALIAAVTVVFVRSLSVPGLPWYGAAVGTLLLAKLVLSLVPEPRRGPAPDGVRVAVVVPMYNEDPAIIVRTLASIEAQDYAPEYVVIVDDGSHDRAALAIAEEWALIRPHAQVIASPVNLGKREALAAAFRALEGQVDVWLCVDSDTVLDPAALSQGLRAFTDPTVAAATGTVIALNPHRGWLARMIDLRYVNAFLYERGAYSTVGSVLCVCGSLTFWRADVITEHLEDFTGQVFLGQKSTYGDDRHLTNQALRHGRVILVHKAVARTAVPERLDHFARQQIRWSKSFFRESLWSLRHLGARRTAWWLALTELASWAVFTAALINVLFVLPLVTHHLHVLDYLAWAALAGYARSVHIFSVHRRDWPRAQQILTFLLSPTYSVLHIVAVIPLRVYALMTLRDVKWGTRARGAEVRLAE